MIFLSYIFNDQCPLYGNGTGIIISPDKQIENGDSCNTTNLSFPNHSGTHIDFPRHFNSEGKTINDYPAAYWQFNHIEIIDLFGKVDDCQIIGPELFSDLVNPKADLLLIKTGYGKYRGTNRYTLTPPGLSADLASFLRKNSPHLRCIGMDLISVSSYSNRKEGRKAHHAFLNPNEGESILLIEDMKLDIDGPFEKVIVAPLLIENADGSPCTVLAYTE